MVGIEEQDARQPIYFDFSTISDANLNMKVDVGAAAYWSELMQIQTLDNLFTKGILTDAITYLEGIPDRYVRGKSKILEKLREAQQNETMPPTSSQIAQSAPPMPTKATAPR